MIKDRLDISDNTAISMPMRNLISIVAAVAVGVWAYFGVLERITMLETKSTLAEKDLEQAQERITAESTRNGKKIYLRKFNNMDQAIDAYLTTLSTGPYNEFRKQRFLFVCRNSC